MTTLRRISPVSAFKVGLLVYLFLGIVVAALMAPILLVVGAAAAHIPGATPMTPLLTLPMLILMPVFYAIFGGLGALIGAAIYNLVSGWVGGLQIQLDDLAGGEAAPATPR
jgi:hypothetical protein